MGMGSGGGGVARGVDLGAQCNFTLEMPKRSCILKSQ